MQGIVLALCQKEENRKLGLAAVLKPQLPLTNGRIQLPQPLTEQSGPRLFECIIVGTALNTQLKRNCAL